MTREAYGQPRIHPVLGVSTEARTIHNLRTGEVTVPADVKIWTLACGWVERIELIVHRGFLLLLIASYLLAASIPSLGQSLRHPVQVGHDELQATVSLSRVLLAVLLFLAGLSIDLRMLWNAVRRPTPLLASLLAKLLVPTCFVLLLAFVFAALGVSPGISGMLLGLALVAAMPTAGSSPAWAQKSGGDVALSLGIVVGSTLLCPWFGGLWWGELGKLLSSFDAQHASELDDLAISVFGTFFLSWFLVPSLLGIVARYSLGSSRRQVLQPHVRFLGNVILLLLIYAFASTSLSKVVDANQFTQLATAFGLAALLCLVNFLAGWLTGKLSRSDRRTKLSMLYAIGMHNNGIALLLADSILPADSIVFLPVIAYAMCQHVVAGITDSIVIWCRQEEPTKGCTMEQGSTVIQMTKPASKNDRVTVVPE